MSAVNRSSCNRRRSTFPTLISLPLIVAIVIFLSYPIDASSSSPARHKPIINKQRWWQRDTSKRRKSSINQENNMGQAVRIMKYDRAANERNAIDALNFLDRKVSLKWYRLDDGVMGGQSETNHHTTNNVLHFDGEINTNGGGFCSIRATLEDRIPSNTSAIRIQLQGDGKTYKFLLSDGSKSTFGPSKRSPSWQADIPTTAGKEEIVTIPLNTLKPSFGGPPASTKPDPGDFQVSEMKEIGFMLSLKLSDGSSNPVETFGEGIFPFSLKVKSIEPVVDQ